MSPRSTKAERSSNRDRLALELKRSAAPFFLFVVLVVGGFLTGIDIISHLTGTQPFDSYKQYDAYFTDVKGVQPGNTPLRIAGVDVGDISAAKVVGHQAELTLNLLSKYAPLYRNAQVSVRPVTPLEDMYVDITSKGTPSAGVLQPGQVIPVSQDSSPVEISNVLDIFDTNTRGDITTLLNELGRGLSGNGGNELREGFEAIAPFLQVTDKLTGAMAAQKTDLAQLVHTFSGISGELDTRDTQLTGFVNYADSTIDSLARSSTSLGATIQDLPPTLSDISSSFQELRTAENSLDPAFRSLSPVAKVLPSGLTALANFSTAATPALKALTPAAQAIKPLAVDLQPTANDLKGAFTTLEPESPLLNRITEIPTQGNCLAYTGSFINQVISLTKFGAGYDNIAAGRANVEVSFEAVLGDLARPTSWRISPICYDVKSGTPES